MCIAKPLISRAVCTASIFINIVPQNELGIYGVGMVMRHKKYNYHCVIIGWDPICKAAKVSSISSFKEC